MEMEPADAASAAVPSSRGRCILRIKLPPAWSAWTADEDARLQRLAKEHGFRRWHHVARKLPGRTARSCRDRWRNHLARDVYHRPFTAGEDDELARLHQRFGDGRWKDISRAVYGRTSRVMKRRWRELRKSDAFLKKLRRPLPPAPPAPPLPPEDDMDADLDDSPVPSSQHPYADVLASAVASCSLSCPAVGSSASTSLALGFACMAV